MKMRLFKYFHPDRTDVLQNSKIRFSSPMVLNDPFELKPYISALAPKSHIRTVVDRNLPKILAEEYSKLPAKLRENISFQVFQKAVESQLPQVSSGIEALMDIFLPMLRNTMSQKLEELIGILCLTESPANLLMWAHYADSHQGFIVEFDSESPFFDQRIDPEDEFRHIRKVSYRDERPVIVLSEVDDFSPFLTKSIDWSYENEWRMLAPLTSASEVIGNGPTAIHLFEFPKSAIKSVILGCRITSSKKTEIRRILCKNDEYLNVRIYNSQIDERHYRLSISEELET
jgi:hypothetical protein